MLRLARPTPKDNARRALFGWLTDKPIEKWAPAVETDLPEEVQALAAFRKAESAEAQVLILGNLRARWDLLADTAKGPAVWAAIARKMGPQALRMNLNTLARHGVIGPDANREMIDYVAGRLADAEEIRRSRQFPYQFLAAYMNVGEEVPQKIKAALHKAAEIACGNVPELPGPIVIGLDVSGSMASPVTGNRGRGATSKMRCVDVAALFAAAILRRNPDSVVIPFDTAAYEAKVDPGDTVLSLAERLARYGGGGTNCSLPLAAANTKYRDAAFCRRGAGERQRKLGRRRPQRSRRRVMTEWQTFVANQVRLHGRGFAGPKLVCIDVQPYTTTQAPDRSDILNVGGFSDAVFNVVAAFLAEDAGRFVTEIEAIDL